MREREVEAYLKKQVELAGGEVRKVAWIGRRGAPDRVVMLRGQTWWIELKAPGKVPEPHQAREHARMQKMGQSVFVVDTKEMVDTLLWPYMGGAPVRARDSYDTPPPTVTLTV